MDLNSQWLCSFTLKGHLYHKVKQSLLTQKKVLEDLFLLKNCLWGNKLFWENLWRELFYMGSNVRLFKEGGKVSQMHFPVF